VAEARELLSEINLVNINFADELPLSPLHWMISDETEAIVVEPMDDGLRVYDNPVGVLTNNPPFDKQLFYLNNYRNLSNKNPENTFGGDIDLDEYSRGMGGIGLPGDLSSASRFAKVAFTRANSYSGDDEASSVSQFFHILGSVEQQNGCTFIANPNLYEYTIYTSCYNTKKGILYYRTYNNSQITAVDLNNEDLDSTGLINYLLINEEQFNFIN
jgi:choloylglycine hydrolase